MNEERIERLKEVAEMADIDIKILRYKNVNEAGVQLVAEKINLDEKIRIFENLVIKGRITDKDDIRAEIDHYLELLGYTLAINHLPAADKALEARNLLMGERRRKISLVMEKKIERKRSEIQRKAAIADAQSICKECGGKCCGRDIEKGFSEMDFFYMFYKLRDAQVNEIWKVLKKPDTLNKNCRFLGENGCVIPPVGKPNFCQGYHCEDIAGIPQKEVDSDMDALDKGMQKIQIIMGKAGFDLKTCD
jgi:hypothetical protein